MSGGTVRGALGATDRPILFAAISTGQAISNLPPILEAASPLDHVVFIETTHARRKGWSAGARAVLDRRNIVSSVHRAPDSLDGWQQEVGAPLLQQAARDGALLVFVANGGTKPMAMLALASFVEGGRLPPMLYSEGRPIELQVWPEGWNKATRYFGLKRGRVTLADIADCGAFDLSPTSERIWPGSFNRISNPYGLDLNATEELHSEYFDYYKDRIRLDRTSLPTFNTSRSHLTDETVQDFAEQIRHRTKPKTSDENLVDFVFNRSRKLAELAQVEIAKTKSVAKPVAGIGDLFELAVARRAHAWLEVGGGGDLVTECWSNVSLTVQDRGSDREAIEMDLAFVLGNGTVLALEMKSSLRGYEDSGSLRKDLHARLHNLNSGTSGLAKMHVCAPLYSDYAGDDWFEEIARDIDERIRKDFSFVPFTLPGQPDGYLNGQTGKTVSVESFEAGLDRIIGGYRRTPHDEI